MKYKALIITTLFFFIAINTTYFWENDSGIYAIPTYIILIVVFIILFFALIQQCYLAIKEKFSKRKRLYIVSFLIIVLMLTYLFPNGIINFYKFSEENVLVAQREGAANCITTVTLNEENKFHQRIVCFQLTDVTGNYIFSNDTIYFENVNLGRNENRFYEFAVIKPSKFNADMHDFDLVMYRDQSDTTYDWLRITKNELSKLKKK